MKRAKKNAPRLGRRYLSSIYDVGSGFVFKNNKGATCVPVTAAGGYDASEVRTTWWCIGTSLLTD